MHIIGVTCKYKQSNIIALLTTDHIFGIQHKIYDKENMIKIHCTTIIITKSTKCMCIRTLQANQQQQTGKCTKCKKINNVIQGKRKDLVHLGSFLLEEHWTLAVNYSCQFITACFPMRHWHSTLKNGPYKW